MGRKKREMLSISEALPLSSSVLPNQKKRRLRLGRSSALWLLKCRSSVVFMAQFSSGPQSSNQSLQNAGHGRCHSSQSYGVSVEEIGEACSGSGSSPDPQSYSSLRAGATAGDWRWAGGWALGGHLGGHLAGPLGAHLGGGWHCCWFCWQDISAGAE